MKKPLFIRTSLAAITVLSMAAVLTACGGGDASDFSNGIETLSISPAGSASVESGKRLSVSAHAETFGPTITAMVWSVLPLGDAKGSVEIFDATCADADIKSRTVPNRTEIVSVWDCGTTVQGVDDASGPFEVRVTVTTDSGAQESDSFTLTVVK